MMAGVIQYQAVLPDVEFWQQRALAAEADKRELIRANRDARMRAESAELKIGSVERVIRKYQEKPSREIAQWRVVQALRGALEGAYR